MPRAVRTPALRTESYESHFEQSTLFEFSKVINSSLDLRFILGHVLLTIMGKILAARGMVLLADRKSPKQYLVEMVKGFPADIAGTAVTIGRLPKSIFALEHLTASKYPWVKFFRTFDVKILIPLSVADRPIGLLGFGRHLGKKKLQAREVHYLRALANIAGTAIETSRTVEEIRQVNRKLDRKVQEMNTLFEIGKEFGSLLDADKLVRLLVLSLLGQVGISRYIVCLREGAEMRVVASRVDGALPEGELLNRMASLKSPAMVEQLPARYSALHRDALASLGVRVVMPMELKGEVRGLLLLGEKLSHEPFNQADLEFLSSLCNVAIISVENARLFKEAVEKQRMEDELMIAREIQKGLLPSVLPEIPGMQIAAANISSRQVGGDYYDVIRLDDRRSVIAIGDVSGKGSPAALLMANLQATIRALVPLDLPLSVLTKKVNELMCENTGGNRFVTFFWGYLDHVGRSLSYVNAGHNYPYLVHIDGSVERLESGGMILGVMKEGITYEQAAVRLSAGDLLVLFTDGVTEAMNPEGQEFGEERLESLLLAGRSHDARSVAEEIHGQVRAFAREAPQSDDITMMVVKVS